jgi:hypothetical protein
VGCKINIVKVQYLFGFLSHVGITFKLQQDVYEVIKSAIKLMIQITWMILQFVMETTGVFTHDDDGEYAADIGGTSRSRDWR